MIAVGRNAAQTVFLTPPASSPIALTRGWMAAFFDPFAVIPGVTCPYPSVIGDVVEGSPVLVTVLGSTVGGVTAPSSALQPVHLSTIGALEVGSPVAQGALLSLVAPTQAFSAVTQPELSSTIGDVESPSEVTDVIADSATPSGEQLPSQVPCE